jgi:cellulase/cellobiase CelA1
MLRRLLMSVLAAVVPLAGLSAAGTAHAAGAMSSANSATTTACTGGVSVSQFAFNPPSVPLGGHSDLTLVLQNCGGQTVQGSTIWYGQYAGQGCPVLDPAYPYPYTIAPGGTYTLTRTYGDPGLSGCRPTSLRMSTSVSVTGVGTVATATATLQFAPACTTSEFRVDQLDFSPVAVAPGQLSTATLVLQNCTGQVVTGSTTWVPRLTWSGSGLPPGCPAMDPVGFPYSIAPGATSVVTLRLGDPVASCPANGLLLTVNVYETGVTNPVYIAQANLGIIQPTPDSCHVTYTPTNWPGGFTANLTITNNGAAAINGWSLAFAFPGDQKITNAWNTTITQSGTSVTAANLSYNALIAPGGSQSFGFQGTWTTGNASPAAFSMNGAACS